jgi:hypothetical protein
MANSHSKSFFGQNTGIILTSWSKYEPHIFLNCIKLKPNGVWEKLSDNEGKIIKLSMEEMVLILQVLNRQNLAWQNNHYYKESKTSISFTWQDQATDVLWINIDNYSKMLNSAQTEILRLLLNHILHEKLIYSTSMDSEHHDQKLDTSSDFYYPNCIEKDEADTYDKYIELPLKNDEIGKALLNDVTNIESMIIGETEKALKLKFEDDNMWIPKSTIHNHYDPKRELVQQFLISNWILKKYKIIS